MKESIISAAAKADPAINNLKYVKVIGTAGKLLGTASIVLTVADAVQTGQFKPSHGLSVAMTAVAFVPVWGWIIGGTYFVADVITIGITGQSIGTHIDNALPMHEGPENPPKVEAWMLQ